MASFVAKAKRNAESRTSLADVIERISKRLGINVPPGQVGRVADPDLLPILEVERFRDVLEQIEARLDELSVGTETKTAPPRRKDARDKAEKLSEDDSSL